MKKEFYNIAKLVTHNSKVLDVGCGNGELMKYITENISKDIRGIELSKSNVQKCVEKGLIFNPLKFQLHTFHELKMRGLQITKKKLMTSPLIEL